MSKVRIRYQTIEFGDTDIHVRTLRDRQEYDDSDGVGEKIGISSANWSLFGVVWQSSQILAHLMSDFDIEGKRILEVGCGIGLPSLVLNHRLADVTATDYHPAAESYLKANTQLNKDADIAFVRTGWADAESTLGKFDLLVGSDILYEDEHPESVAEFINQHANQRCEVIIVDPGRKRHAKFSKKMVILGFTHCENESIDMDILDKPFKCQVIRFTR